MVGFGFGLGLGLEAASSAAGEQRCGSLMAVMHVPAAHVHARLWPQPHTREVASLGGQALLSHWHLLS